MIGGYSMQKIRLMGEGYEPCVNKLGNQLLYSIPVESGFASYDFIFEINQNDLNILLSDDYRRAVLEIIAHELLQFSKTRKNSNFSQSDFNQLIMNTLHASSNDLQTFIEQIGKKYNISINSYVKNIMNKRSGTN